MENKERVEVQLEVLKDVFNAIGEKADYHKPSALYYPDCYIISFDEFVELEVDLRKKYISASKQ